MAFVDFVKELTPESTSALLDSFLLSVGVHQIDWNYILTPSNERGREIAARLLAPEIAIAQSERSAVSTWYFNQQANTFGDAVLRYLHFMEEFALNADYDMTEFEYAKFIEKQLSIEDMLASLPTKANSLSDLQEYMTRITDRVDDMIYFYNRLQAKKSPALVNFYRQFHHNFTTRVYIWSLVGMTLGKLLAITEKIAAFTGKNVFREFSTLKFDPTNSSSATVLRQIHATSESARFNKGIEYVLSGNYRPTQGFGGRTDLEYFARVPRGDSDNIIARTIDRQFGTAVNDGVAARTIFLYGVPWATYFGRGYLPSENVTRLLIYLVIYFIIQYIARQTKNKSRREIESIVESISDMVDRKDDIAVELKIVRNALDILREHGGEISDAVQTREFYLEMIDTLVKNVSLMLKGSCLRVFDTIELVQQIQTYLIDLLKVDDFETVSKQLSGAKAVAAARPPKPPLDILL